MLKMKINENKMLKIEILFHDFDIFLFQNHVPAPWNWTTNIPANPATTQPLNQNRNPPASRSRRPKANRNPNRNRKANPNNLRTKTWSWLRMVTRPAPALRPEPNCARAGGWRRVWDRSRMWKQAWTLELATSRPAFPLLTENEERLTKRFVYV